jgi:hypothetical protein
MFFVREDDLAIHTVASAAYRIIADLKAKRGCDEVGDYYKTMIFYVVRDYHCGTLPKLYTDNPEMMKWIRNMAGQFPFTPSMKYEDIKVAVSKKTAMEWWEKRNKFSNFLKHADQDPKAHISLQDIDNLNLLTLALASYSDLIKDDLGAEGLTLWIYSCVVNQTKEQIPAWYRVIANDLDKCDPDEQLRLCSLFIDRLNENVAKELVSQGFGPENGPHQ